MPKVTKKTLNCRGRLVDLTTPAVMGILNITPDSFYEGSRIQPEKVVETAAQMLHDGAVFLDVGGYSTRPGADDISPSEEIDRLLPAIDAILTAFPAVFLSVDTFRADVARHAISAGACLINDVSGGTLDPAMFKTVAELAVPYILMHMRGTPKTMNTQINYESLILDIIDELSPRIARLKQLGVSDIILDPGFGFAKTPAQNFQLLNQLEAFKVFDEALLVGLSRKSTIWRTLKIRPEDALNGTTVMNTIGLLKGASILRVHDVKEAVEAIKLVTQLNFSAKGIAT